MKYFLFLIKLLVAPFLLLDKSNVAEYRCVHLNGKRVLLTEKYPLPSAKLTKGKVYNMIDEVYYTKQVTSFASIPIKFYEILNDDQEPILVSIHYFKFC